MSEIEDRQLAQYTLQWADGATGQEVRLAFAVIEAQDGAKQLLAERDALALQLEARRVLAEDSRIRAMFGGLTHDESVAELLGHGEQRKIMGARDNETFGAATARVAAERDALHAQVEAVRWKVAPQWRSIPNDVPEASIAAYSRGRNDFIDALRAALTPTTDAITDHDFLPVAGHPDDDECTFRSDGTDLTYCAETKEMHRG